MPTLHEQAHTPALNVLPVLSERDLPSWGGQKVVFNTSWMTGSVSLEGGYTYRPHQSWQNTSYGPTEGVGMYLTMEEGSWRVGLFAFDETTKPTVDQFDFWTWDQQVFGPTGGRKEHFIGKLQFTNDITWGSLTIKTLDKAGATEAMHVGDDIVISAGTVRNAKDLTIGEGTARIPGRPGPPTRMTTRLFENTDDLVWMLDRITEGRLGDNDRTMLWASVEKQLDAMAEARQAKPELRDKKQSSKLQKLREAVGSLVSVFSYSRGE